MRLLKVLINAKRLVKTQESKGQHTSVPQYARETPRCLRVALRNATAANKYGPQGELRRHHAGLVLVGTELYFA